MAFTGIEPCLDLIKRDQIKTTSSFRGLLQDIPSGQSTAIVNGLSQQLIYQLQLNLPNVFVSFETLNVDLLDAAFPYVQLPAKQALERAIKDRGIQMLVNSCYRTIAQQMLLYNDRFLNPNPVAPPGASNHQTGLAIDIEDAQGWAPYLIPYGWQPLPGDPPHFDYYGSGTIDIRSQSILAFQQLWNKNNPNTQMIEDGLFGPQTENALNQSPAYGFLKAPWDDNPRVLKLSQPMMEGYDVEQLQIDLRKAGINVTVDGKFGPETDKAVKEFQRNQGLIADGIVDMKRQEVNRLAEVKS